MPTATETPEKTETVTFLSRSENQVLTRRSATVIRDDLGHKVTIGFEQWLEQQEQKNHERVLAGADPLPIDDTPWAVKFKNYEFETDHPKLIEWLRGHRLCGHPDIPSGFIEVQAPAGEREPKEVDQLRAIVEAQADLEADKVNDVLELERETHNRPAIIQTAEAALRKLAESPSEPEGDAVPDQGAEPSPSEN